VRESADFATGKTGSNWMIRISFDENATVTPKRDEQRARIRTIEGTTGHNIHCLASNENSKKD